MERWLNIRMTNIEKNKNCNIFAHHCLKRKQTPYSSVTCELICYQNRFWIMTLWIRIKICAISEFMWHEYRRFGFCLKSFDLNWGEKIESIEDKYDSDSSKLIEHWTILEKRVYQIKEICHSHRQSIHPSTLINSVNRLVCQRFCRNEFSLWDERHHFRHQDRTREKTTTQRKRENLFINSCAKC